MKPTCSKFPYLYGASVSITRTSAALKSCMTLICTLGLVQRLGFTHSGHLLRVSPFADYHNQGNLCLDVSCGVVAVLSHWERGPVLRSYLAKGFKQESHFED